MGSQMTPSYLTLSDIERSKSWSLGFQSVIYRKGTNLGPILPLTINRKPYMERPVTPSLLTLRVLVRSKPRPLRF